jgi:hypothetical protein
MKRTIWSVEGNVALCADLTPKELVSATESGACRSHPRTGSSRAIFAVVEEISEGRAAVDKGVAALLPQVNALGRMAFD